MLKWINKFLDYDPKNISINLDNIIIVAKSMNILNIWEKTTIITVAGTNGKGSTIATLESIYHFAGYKVASYTSPHLLYVNERIKIYNQPVSDNILEKSIQFVNKCRGNIELTYFELITLSALWIFKNIKLDLIFLEVGLGGRLDAVNIINPDLSIITTISLDHQEILGHTIDKIAYEKAGILRKNKPFIFADINIPDILLEIGKNKNCSMFILNKHYSYEIKKNNILFKFQNTLINFPKTSLHNSSISAAIMACIYFRNIYPISNDQISYGIKNIVLLGRLQTIKLDINSSPIILDVSHNPQATKYLSKFIKNIHCTGKIYAIFSALKDKNLHELIFSMKDIVHFWYPTLLKTNRAASVQLLQDAFLSNKLPFYYYKDPVCAYKKIQNISNKNDLIVVFGSFITVQNILLYIEKNK